MNSFTRYIAIICTVLITAGFALSGFHFHDERNPDGAEDEVSIVHELDFCLLCEGIFSEQPEKSLSADSFFDISGDVIIIQRSVFSPHLIHIQDSRAPPATV